jgi:hypothetical protein
MSGGPVFWSTAEVFDLIGFIYEGDQTGLADDFIEQSRARFFVVPCDYYEFSRWVEELQAAASGIAAIKRIG